MFYDDDLMIELEYFKDTYDSFNNHLWDYLSNNFLYRHEEFTVKPYFQNDVFHFEIHPYGELDDFELEEMLESGFECIHKTINPGQFCYRFREAI